VHFHERCVWAEPQQKIGERIPGLVRIRGIVRVSAVENEIAPHKQALQIRHGEVRELKPPSRYGVGGSGETSEKYHVLSRCVCGKF